MVFFIAMFKEQIYYTKKSHLFQTQRKTNICYIFVSLNISFWALYKKSIIRNMLEYTLC